MLRDALRHLIRTTAGYSINTLIGPIFTLLLTPIYTRLLGPASYGTVDTLVMLGTVIALLGVLGLTSSLTALYYDPQHQDQQQRIVASALWAAVIWSSLLGLAVFIGALPLTQLTLARSDVADLARLTAIGLPFSVVYSIQSVVLRLRFAVWRANLLALIYILASAAANVLFVIVLRWGPTGVISAYAAVNVVMGLAGLALAPASLGVLPGPAFMWHLVRLGLPLVPAHLAVWLLVYEDRLFLVRYVSQAQIGLYAIAIKLASRLSLLIGAFQATWLPLALSIQQQPGAPRTYAKVLTYYCVGSLGLGLGLSLFAHEILLIFTTPAFVGAAAYVWLLVLPPLTSGLYTIVTVGLYIEQRLGQVSWTTAAAAGINTALNFLLIPGLGVLGAAIATAVGYLASPLLAAWVAQRTHPFPYEWQRAGKALIVYCILIGLGLVIGSRAEPLSIALRGLLLCAYLPLLWLAGVFERWEVQLACRAIRQPRMVLRWVTGRV